MKSKVFYTSLIKTLCTKNRFLFRGTSNTKLGNESQPIDKKTNAPSVKVDLDAIQKKNEGKSNTSPGSMKEFDLKIDQSEKLKPHNLDSLKKGPISEFESYLHSTILMRGPMSLATFMKEVLTNKKYGYYMNRDVFGKKGDFITSPEISQLFGEMVGLWCYLTWEQMGKPDKLNLVELGPGRGTLMSDILRTAKQLNDKTFYNSIQSVQFVEVSPALRNVQASTLGIKNQNTEQSDSSSSHLYDSRIRVQWRNIVSELQIEGPVLFLGNEFFDCIPIYQFEYTKNGWRERLIDIDSDQNSPFHFRYVVSSSPTAASIAFLRSTQMHHHLTIPPNHIISGLGTSSVQTQYREGDVLEVSPESSLIIQEIGKKINQNSGAGLFIDYGYDYDYEKTLHPQQTVRAIKGHVFQNLFKEVGSADLSCSVDFAGLRYALKFIEGSKVYGTVSQSKFLQELGIVHRYENLMNSNISQEDKNALTSGFEKLISPKEMGTLFKVLGFSSKSVKGPLVGFS